MADLLPGQDYKKEAARLKEVMQADREAASKAASAVMGVGVFCHFDGTLANLYPISAKNVMDVVSPSAKVYTIRFIKPFKTNGYMATVDAVGTTAVVTSKTLTSVTVTLGAAVANVTVNCTGEQ